MPTNGRVRVRPIHPPAIPIANQGHRRYDPRSQKPEPPMTDTAPTAALLIIGRGRDEMVHRDDLVLG